MFGTLGCSNLTSFYYSVNSLCYDVCPTGTLQNQEAQTCTFYIQYCLTILLNKCQLCKPSFIRSANNDSCSCLVGSIITNTCINMPGCLNAQVLNGTAICLFCDLTRNMFLVDNVCQCKTGFSNSSSLSTSSCTQLCGDGYIYVDQCDDGNSISGDGCSNSCVLESGFNCSRVLIGGTLKTVCKP